MDVLIDSIVKRDVAPGPGARRNRCPAVTIVVPCFNEEGGLRETVRTLSALLIRLQGDGHASAGSALCLVDDGSTDATWAIIRSLAAANPLCCAIRLTRNFGHQNALLAGLLSAPGDVLISLDADLQDDPGVIPDMLAAYRNGAEIVFAVRDDRSTDSVFKRTSARLYYKLLKTLGVRIVEDHADYRLMSRRAVESLRGFPETNLFLRALVPQLGFTQAVVHYKRQARFAGTSKYTIKKMLSLAINGVTAFSAAPLRCIAIAGVVIFTGSVAIAAWALWTRLYTGNAVPGWASSVVPLYLLGGIQLLGIGVVGEYVAKLYLEAKGRPRFLLQETLALDGGAEEAIPAIRRRRKASSTPLV